MHPELRFRFERISPGVLADFLAEKGAKMTCHQCGCDNFSIPTVDIISSYAAGDPRATEDELRQVALVPHAVSSDDPVMTHKVYFYPMTCKNCGVIQSVNAQTVLSWFESPSRGNE